METQSPPVLSSEATAVPSRLSRFADWTSIQNLCDRTFYHAEQSDIRMSEVRKAIEYIRGRWSDYSTFMQELREYINQLGITDKSSPTDEDRHALESLLSCSKDWADRSPTQSHSFDAIHLYTSEFGYDTIFALLNVAFRTDAFTEKGQERGLRSAVFLIELLNIDLFNYLLLEPSRSGFQGIVYRGVAFTEEEIKKFRNLATLAVRDRYWSIPLAMMSASTSITTALQFALGQAQKDPTKLPFLWRIHVANLDPDLLQIYNDKFPSSVVTTLCAVPLDGVSGFSKEQEVLLRGPWFQFIRLHEEFVHEAGMDMNVMDLVMLNSNRDHPSVAELGVARGDEARKLFALLVGVSRAMKCKNLAHAYGLAMDADEFGRIYDEQVDRLWSIRSGENPGCSCGMWKIVSGARKGIHLLLKRASF
ncbi:hypothetical protein BJV78DRAFT_594032 [Lactifluus subvellereus]|nr:hypothetical protein BJV78DRAFT_594032 [Lactifluus subvellereus]